MLQIQKKSINQADINIEQTKQRIESTKWPIEQSKSIFSFANKQITLIKRKNRNDINY